VKFSICAAKTTTISERSASALAHTADFCPAAIILRTQNEFMRQLYKIYPKTPRRKYESEIIAFLCDFYGYGDVCSCKQRGYPVCRCCKAREDIATLQAENEDLTAKSAALVAENRELEAKIEGWQQKLFFLTPLLEKVRIKNGDLYATISRIIDPQMKQRGVEALQKNRALRTELEEKQAELEDLLASAEEIMQKNSGVSNTYNQRVLRNKDSITLLEAAIAKTETQNALVMEYIESVETFLQEARGLLDTEL